MVKLARHHAVESGVSLSGWLEMLIEREVEGTSGGKQQPVRLLEALGEESLKNLLQTEIGHFPHHCKIPLGDLLFNYATVM